MKLAGHNYCEAMHEIWNTLTTEDSDPIEATTLRNLVKGKFRLYQQDDAMQFLFYVFDKLQQEQTPKSTDFSLMYCFNHNEAWTGYFSEFTSITDSLFTGMYQKNMTCKKWNQTVKVFEVFIHITLEIATGDVSQAYHEYISHMDEINEARCQVCGDIATQIHTKEIVKLPQYCIFQINRFDPQNDRKNSKFMLYPRTLNLKDKYDPVIRYDLISVIIHNGDLEEGHYSTIGRRNDQWVLFNDSITEILEDSNELNNQAYILFYKRVD